MGLIKLLYYTFFAVYPLLLLFSAAVALMLAVSALDLLPLCPPALLAILFSGSLVPWLPGCV